MKNKQITGNIGLFYVCCELSRRGWNVMPTSRNARGMDIVAYKGKKTLVKIEVKTQTTKTNFFVGQSVNDLLSDFWVFVEGGNPANAKAEYSPEIYILSSKDVRKFAQKGKTKAGKPRYTVYLKKEVRETFDRKWKTIK